MLLSSSFEIAANRPGSESLLVDSATEQDRDPPVFRSYFVLRHRLFIASCIYSYPYGLTWDLSSSHEPSGQGIRPTEAVAGLEDGHQSV